MHSLRSAIAVTTTLIAATSAYQIDPESVSGSTRESWCASELDTCPLLCQQYEPQITLVNTCDSDSLTYGCLCGNNQKPNVTEYTLTLPYFVCTEWGNQCVTKCNGDSTCASACRQDHPCGASDPQRHNKTKASGTASLSPSPSSTDDSTTIYTGTPGDLSTSDSSGSASDKSASGGHSAGVALEAGRAFGMGIFVSGLFGAFLML